MYGQFLNSPYVPGIPKCFLAFIDLKKAFDSVDKNLLLYKLSKIGVSGHFYRAISSLYSNPRPRVILNEYET